MIGYFDLETLYLHDEVGGWEFASKMGLSVACLYNDEDRAYKPYIGPDPKRKGAFCYEGEDDSELLLEDLTELELLVGFNVKEFDLSVLKPYADRHGVSLDHIPVFDILLALGETVNRPYPASLESLASINLGRIGQKIIDPKNVVNLYRKGLIDEVILYCIHDVWSTRMVFQTAYETGKLKMRTRRGTYEIVDVSEWRDDIHRLYGATNIVF